MTRDRLCESLTLAAYDLDSNNWPQVLIENIHPRHQGLFSRRKEAVDMYLKGDPLGQIRQTTGISDDEVIRLVKRCVQVDEFGVTYGYRALIPYKHVTEYHRKRSSQGCESGMSGVFEQLLDTYPVLRDEIHALYLDRRKRRPRERIPSIKRIHQRFLSMCRELGLTAADYPFTNNDSGLRSLNRYCKKLDSLFFQEAASRHGDHAKNSAKLVSFGQPHSAIIRPFERVQFDGHRIDAILSVKRQTPEGDYITETLNRIWLLTVNDVATGTVLGYHLSLNKEYTSVDVLRCFRSAVVPHKKMEFTIPHLRYPKFKISEGLEVEGGFPSDFCPETHWAKFDEISLDNGKANLSNVVLERLQNCLKCSVGPGPVGAPTRRGLIERFFGVLEEQGFHRLISTTGSSPNDPRRQRAEEAAKKYEITFAHLCEVTEVLISQYNLTPHARVNNLTPLEAMRQRVQERGLVPRVMDDTEQEEVIFLIATETRTVRGSTTKGRRPHINYMGCEYRSPLLDQSAFLIGEKLTLQIDLDDLQVVKAFKSTGEEFGKLVAQGKWGLYPHNWELRSTILNLKNKGLLRYGEHDDPIDIYHQYLEETATEQKISRNRLVQLDKVYQKKKEEDLVYDVPSSRPSSRSTPELPKSPRTKEEGREKAVRLFTKTKVN